MKYSNKFLSLGLAVFCLLIFTVLWFLYDYQKQNESYYVNRIENNVNREVKEIEDLYSKLPSPGDSIDFTFDKLNELVKQPLIIIDGNEEAIYWSTSHYLPLDNVSLKTGVNLVSNKDGDFLTYVFPRNEYQYIFYLPLFVKSEINNAYINPQANTGIFENDGIRISELIESPDQFIIKVKGVPVFSVSFQPSYRIHFAFADLFMFLSILVFAIFFTVFIAKLAGSYHRSYAIPVGILTVLIFRILALFLEFPYEFINLRLFNPKFFSASWLVPTLGDLMLNIIALSVFAIGSMYYYQKPSVVKAIHKLGRIKKLALSTLLFCLGISSLSLQMFIFRTLYHHSSWTYDITSNLSFSGLKMISVLIIFLSLGIFILFGHIAYQVNIHVWRKEPKVFWILLSASSLIFVLLTYLTDNNFIPIVIIYIVYTLSMYGTRAGKLFVRVRYNTLFYIIGSLIITSIAVTISVWTFEQERIRETKGRVASKLIEKNDVLGEFLLHEALEQIKEDKFIQARLLSPIVNRKSVEDKVQKYHLGSYFDKYNIDITLFGIDKEPVDIVGSQVPYQFFKFYYESEEYKTEYENIYFESVKGKPLLGHYIALLEIPYNDKVIGYMKIDLNLLNNQLNTVFPELLVDTGVSSEVDEFKNVSYAFYENLSLLTSGGEFNYSLSFPNLRDVSDSTKLFTKGLVVDKYRHYAQHGEEDQILLVSVPYYPVSFLISNFSFYFVLPVLFILLSSFILTIYHFIKSTRVSFTTKLQLYLNLVFLIPLMAVSYSAINLISTTYRNDIRSEYLQKSKNTSDQLIDDINKVFTGDMTREELEKELKDISRFAQLDINLYDVDGYLLATSQPRIFEKKIFSNQLNPEAYAKIIERGYEEIIIDEKAGDLSFKSSFSGVNAFNSNRKLGVINIPYFESGEELENHIIDGIVNILNLAAFTFLIFLAISYFSSSMLTKPLRYIANKIGKTSLGDNEPLNWKSNDEIGLLVEQYNRMLGKLEESRRALSASEKESAWREMAKQVAHEIKNPLTPMRLSLQHLQRLNDSDDKLKNLSESLIRQVDTLSDIATSFSAFAKMPIPESAIFNLTKVVRDSAEIFKRQEGAFKVDIPDEEIIVKGDEKLIGRIINNLLINAKQSVVDEGTAEIFLELSVQDDKNVMIMVKDNGEGIPDSLREKVFIPNFSTKSTGSGIGLAIAKRGIEHAQGSIWFESEIGKGTVFFISLPLYKDA
ncbi:sensor histidine kinase [Marinigracilibium pacificum]|uniref:histidine kinase n=1 Tax=Marinigracilibium pacificum TaxID=2729599 RepID=A0A848J701_9BACT|nr:HAMP domain-containing sensor histidine kinase [Marinigracilibium pacificum]NMM50169.1 hypothetical protein [Marinigracilibium pacificum]